jgi:hypothetical protein
MDSPYIYPVSGPEAPGARPFDARRTLREAIVLEVDFLAILPLAIDLNRRIELVQDAAQGKGQCLLPRVNEVLGHEALRRGTLETGHERGYRRD